MIRVRTGSCARESEGGQSSELACTVLGLSSSPRVKPGEQPPPLVTQFPPPSESTTRGKDGGGEFGALKHPSRGRHP